MSFHEVPLNAVYARIDAGRKASDDLQTYFRARIEVENAAGTTLKRKSWPKNLPSFEVPGSTMMNAVEALRIFNLETSDDYFLFSQALALQVSQPLLLASKSAAEGIDRVRNNVNLALQRQQNSEDSLKKAKKSLSKAVKDVENCQIKLDKIMQSQEEGSRKEDISQATEKLMRAENIRRMCDTEVRQKRQELFQAFGNRDQTVGNATNAFRAFEKERMERFVSAMRTLLHLERQRLLEREKSLKNLENSISSIDIARDLENFANSNKNLDHTHQFLRALVLLDWDWERNENLRKSLQQQNQQQQQMQNSQQQVGSAGGGVGEARQSLTPDDGSVFQAFRSLGRSLFGAIAEDSPNPPPLPSSNLVPFPPNLSSGTVIGTNSGVTPLLTPTAPIPIPLSTTTTTTTAATTTMSGSNTVSPASVVLQTSDGSSKNRNSHGSNSSSNNNNNNNNNAQPQETQPQDELSVWLGPGGNKQIAEVCDSTHLPGSTVRAAFTQLKNILVPPSLATETTATTTDTQPEQEPKLARDCVALHELLQTEPGREAFVRVLNDKRGQTGRGLLTNRGFELLTQAMWCCLDTCHEGCKDLSLTKRLGIMASTFHRLCPEKSPNESDGSVSAGDLSARSTTSEGSEREREYITQRLKHHKLWSEKWVWEDFVLSGVATQFDLSPQQVRWDDLTSDQLRCEVIRIHNTVFSQLTAVVFNMCEMDLDPQLIAQFINRMCDQNQLSEDQRLELLRGLQSRTERTHPQPQQAQQQQPKQPQPQPKPKPSPPTTETPTPSVTTPAPPAIIEPPTTTAANTTTTSTTTTSTTAAAAATTTTRTTTTPEGPSISSPKLTPVVKVRKQSKSRDVDLDEPQLDDVVLQQAGEPTTTPTTTATTATPATSAPISIPSPSLSIPMLARDQPSPSFSDGHLIVNQWEVIDEYACPPPPTPTEEPSRSRVVPEAPMENEFGFG